MEVIGLAFPALHKPNHFWQAGIWGAGMGCQIWIWHFGNWKNLLIIDTINYTPVSADGNANTIFLTNDRFNWMIMMVFCYKVISSSLPKANTKRCLHRIHYMSLLPIHTYDWDLVFRAEFAKVKLTSTSHWLKPRTKEEKKAPTKYKNRTILGQSGGNHFKEKGIFGGFWEIQYHNWYYHDVSLNDTL